MSVASDAAARAEAEVASSPDVWFVLLRCGPCGGPWTGWRMQPLYAVQLPDDIGRFRLDGGSGVEFRFRGRWRPVIGAWRQLKRLNLDAAENRACDVASFGRRILEPMGVMRWKRKRESTSGTTGG